MLLPTVHQPSLNTLTLTTLRAKKLKYLDPMGSKKVYGKIGSDWTGGDTLGQYVTELMIGKTNVGFDVPEILARERRFLPNLTIVSVKGSKLAMDVWKFLYPFSSIRFLKKVDASGCDLSGAVHTLYGESGSLVQWKFCSTCECRVFTPARVPTSSLGCSTSRTSHEGYQPTAIKSSSLGAYRTRAWFCKLWNLFSVFARSVFQHQGYSNTTLKLEMVFAFHVFNLRHTHTHKSHNSKKIDSCTLEQ